MVADGGHTNGGHDVDVDVASTLGVPAVNLPAVRRRWLCPPLKKVNVVPAVEKVNVVPAVKKVNVVPAVRKKQKFFRKKNMSSRKKKHIPVMGKMWTIQL